MECVCLVVGGGGRGGQAELGAKRLKKQGEMSCCLVHRRSYC